METEGKKILVDYLTDVADTFRSITGETGLIDARTYSTEIEKVAGGSGSKNSYQRNSVEEMNAITDAKDGDTCLCYHIDSFNITEDATVSTITFPEEVVFENAITEYYNAEIRAADSNVELWGMIDLSPNNFMFQVDKMDDRSSANVFYSSEDGITYILDQTPRIEGSFELVDERTINFKMNITIQNTNEYIGAFLSSDNSIFYGLFKYNGGWKTLGLNYPLNSYSVEALQKYYNNGEQEGMLGKTDTQQGILKLNNFIDKYGIDFAYPEDMSNYFQNYKGDRVPLLELNPNTGNTTSMTYMFADCSSLKTIPVLNTSNVTRMNGMFAGCSSLKTIPTLDTSNVAYIDRMFYGCSSLETIPALDTSNVTNMSDMFADCSSLKTIPALNTSNVTNMYETFFKCSSLETIPMLDTSKVVYMGRMLYGCSSLETIPTLDTSKVTGMSYMFADCSSLKAIPALDTSNVTSMWAMFADCSSLETIPMLDASGIEEINGMFEKCSSLTTFGGLKNLGKSYSYKKNSGYTAYILDLSDSPLLTHESLMNVINNLYNLKSIQVKTQKLKIGETNKAKLTAEEIAIATNKGWSVE